MATQHRSDERLELLEKSLSDLVRSFPKQYWRDCDEKEEFPQEFWQKLAQGGWFGINIPERYGGAGLGMSELSRLTRLVASSGSGLIGGNTFVLEQAIVYQAVLDFGTEAQKDLYLPAMAKGEIVGCFALTEPRAGVNTFAMETFARDEGDSFVITGQKVWTTLAHVSNLMVLAARTKKLDEVRRRSDGISLFLVNPKDPAVRVFKIKKMAMKALGSNQVFFDGLRIPRDALLGEKDQGWLHLRRILNAERIGTASESIGVAELALDLAVDYAKERRIFGRPIGQNQGIQFPLADSKIKLEAAGLMTDRAAELFDKGADVAVPANMAAYLSAQAAFEAVDRALQTFGGWAYSRDMDIERHWRDLRLWRSVPIPEQMVLNYISQHVLGFPRSY